MNIERTVWIARFLALLMLLAFAWAMWFLHARLRAIEQNRPSQPPAASTPAPSQPAP